MSLPARARRLAADIEAASYDATTAGLALRLRLRQSRAAARQRELLVASINDEASWYRSGI
jgi:hypothetical protein